jgi:DNA-binding response OmpR family regulator
VRFFALKNILVEACLNWKDGFYKASINYYDAIILDISLPEMDWIEICEKLREKEKTTPIIMLTSRATKKDIINWLESGADDYLIKPFNYDELIARIKSLTRRNLKNKSNKINIWEFNINLEKIEVFKNNKEIKLSNLEFKLFSYLAQNKEKVISRRELYEKVWWEFDWDFMFSKTVEVYIWYLRKKLDKDLIQTVKWVWYVIK